MSGPCEALRRMTTEELVLLLAVSQEHREDQWFRNLIVDEIKTRDVSGLVPSTPTHGGAASPP